MEVLTFPWVLCTAGERGPEAADGEHGERDQGVGGVEAVGAAGDQAQGGVDRFCARVREPVRECGDDPAAVLADRLGELGEAGDAAASGPGKPGVQQRDRRLRVRLVEDEPQLLLSRGRSGRGGG